MQTMNSPNETKGEPQNWSPKPASNPTLLSDSLCDLEHARGT